MTSNVRQRLARALAWLERLASRRLGAVILFALGLAVYWVQAIGWPLTDGRDLDEYLLDYIQLLNWHPLLPWAMLFRTPVTPVIAGGSLEVWHGRLAEPLLSVLFAASVVAWSAAARTFGARPALLVAVAVLVFPAYALMFHELASEVVFAAAFSGWALLVTRAAARPSTARFALVGLGVAVLALIRPGNAVLLVFVLFPFVLPGARRQRAVRAGALATAAILPLVAWAVLNGARFGDYTLARGGNAVIPFYRAFITDKIISPSNGPASRELANAIQQHLLTRNPYKAYGVTLDEVFKSGSFRIHEDLYNLSDQVFGWDSDYSVLRRAGIEGVRAHPGKYSRDVLDTIWQELSRSYFRTPPSAASTTSSNSQQATIDVNGRQLPAPTEGQPIPGGQNAWISRPDNSIRQVWTSPTQYHFAFTIPSQRAPFDAIVQEKSELLGRITHRKPNSELLLRFNQASRWFPRPIIWIVVGLIALAIRRPRGSLTLIALAIGAMLVIALNAFGLFADQHFSLPVAPAFVLLGATALVGPRARAGSD